MLRKTPVKGYRCSHLYETVLYQLSMKREAKIWHNMSAMNVFNMKISPHNFFCP